MKIRTRILLLFILTTSLGVASLLFWLRDELQPRYLEAQEDILVDMAQVLAVLIRERALVATESGPSLQPEYLGGLLDEAFRQPIDARIYAFHKTHVDLRIYVTDAQGSVLYDSDQGRDLGKDYSQWRDVYLTLQGRYGARSTAGDRIYPEGATMYVAAPITLDGAVIGVVTIGKPTRNAERFRVDAITNFSVAGLIAVAGTMGLGLVVYWWVSRPLQRLHDYARAVEAGVRVPLPALGKNEIGQVGQAMEAMRTALDGKSYVADYVQSLTHELKSPTAAIRGAAELLDEEMPVRERHRFIANIRGETERIQDIVDRLLGLAKIESYRALELAETIDMAALIRDAAASLFPLAEERGVQVQTQAAPCPPIKGDPFLLQQAVDNLLKNAIEFSPEGGQVGVRLECGQGQVRISVDDQGPGIPDFAKPRVFERFYSLARPDGRKGTGLGLSFVREIAALHHGSVGIRDGRDARGTVAELILPLPKSAPNL